MKTNTNNLFIQSFMDNDSKTFLEIGSTITEKFTSVPTDFKVTFNGTCWIDITKDNLLNYNGSGMLQNKKYKKH